MSKHTGGNWKIGKWSGGGPPQLEISSDEDICWIAGVGAPCEDPEVAEANARLVIAAPKLLKACQGLLSFIEAFDMGGDWCQDNYPAVKAAHAAIAEVTKEVTCE